MMKTLSTLILGLLMTTSTFTQAPESVTFAHQIRQFLMVGDDTEKIDMSATLTADGMTFTPAKKGRSAVTIPYASISSLVYDRRSRVRKMLVGSRGNFGGKAEDHFLTIQYKTGTVGDYIEIEMGKDTAPRLLATLESRSGKQIDRASGS